MPWIVTGRCAAPAWPCGGSCVAILWREVDLIRFYPGMQPRPQA